MSHSKALPHAIVVIQGGVVQNVLGVDYIVWDWDDINDDPAALPDMKPFMHLVGADAPDMLDVIRHLQPAALKHAPRTTLSSRVITAIAELQHACAETSNPDHIASLRDAIDILDQFMDET